MSEPTLSKNELIVRLINPVICDSDMLYGEKEIRLYMVQHLASHRKARYTEQEQRGVIQDIFNDKRNDYVLGDIANEPREKEIIANQVIETPDSELAQ